MTMHCPTDHDSSRLYSSYVPNIGILFKGRPVAERKEAYGAPEGDEDEDCEASRTPNTQDISSDHNKSRSSRGSTRTKRKGLDLPSSFTRGALTSVELTQETSVYKRKRNAKPASTEDAQVVVS